MNPFNQPDQAFNVGDFLDHDPKKVEILFKDFFQQQSQDDLLDLSPPLNASPLPPLNSSSPLPPLKLYQINRYLPMNGDNLEIIQAYSRSQAAYLFLLYEAQTSETYPFADRLRYCQDMGVLTPYDVYSLTLDTIFDKDLFFNDYLVEIEELILIK